MEIKCPWNKVSFRSPSWAICLKFRRSVEQDDKCSRPICHRTMIIFDEEYSSMDIRGSDHYYGSGYVRYFENLIRSRTYIKDYYEVKKFFKGPLFHHYVRRTWRLENGWKFLKRFIIRSLWASRSFFKKCFYQNYPFLRKCVLNFTTWYKKNAFSILLITSWKIFFIRSKHSSLRFIAFLCAFLPYKC